MVFVFWALVATLVYVYLGYPCLIWALGRLRPRRIAKAPHLPTVSFIISAYNEESAIEAKLENTLALDYPPERLEILVASDGSTDRTEAIVERFVPRVKLLALRGRNGKTMAQNKAVEAATGEILFFSDATTVYARDVVRQLMANYADPAVGAVGARVIIGGAGSTESLAKGRSVYTDYEFFLRRYESRFSSTLGAGGCAYTLRRSLYTPLPADIISDFCQVVKVMEQGYRSVIEDDAVVYEPPESYSIREELQRRTRVITRGLRGLFYMRPYLAGHPWFAFQVVSHRLLRWMAPFFLILIFLANAALLDRPFFRLLFVAQAALYLVAALAYALERRNIRLPGLFIPLYFFVLNLAPLLAVRALLRGERKATWETGRA
jgi:cellulose synthase/poly-beta-1,6-N-acetylglucosamine synthase-like glycosyltransferase